MSVRRQDEQDGFTQDEVDLLGSKGVVSGQDGRVHLEKYADSRRMITPVNPHAELRRLSDVHANGTVIN